ncbi:isochorismatase family protein [Brachybacterium sp. EF45031]|uniref:isochorismatase family protein n=1 Tax=Brachybacterium sillae TaxID=2810536 RepID=UPI00217F05D5|nr:isochorismatase family protein [Brachybacterium sillae]MCS6711658.1 isochorismatase family protein [Brachybacterium sillae]
MTRTMLIVVDVQNDFCEGGALGVDGGAAVAQRIAAHLRDHAEDYDMVVVSQDWHDPDSDNGGHFSDAPDFVDSWPVHCCAGSEGAELHPALAAALEEVGTRLGDRLVRVRKGFGEPAYSVLEGTVTGGPSDGAPFGELLADVDEAVVVGLAYDYCVRATALGVRGESEETPVAAAPTVQIPRDLTAPVHSDVSALETELRGHGIEIRR